MMILLYRLLQALLADGGQRYTETDLSHLIVEPWNGASAALFLLIVGYWAFKLRGQYRRHLFLSINLPILAIGGIGGTLFHAFRVSEIFLLMDWLPITILCMAASVYFFIRVLDHWWQAALLVGLTLLSQVLMFQYEWLPIDLAVNVNYSVMGALILLPTVLLLWKTEFYAGKWVGYALAAFVLAIACRALDSEALLPMGPHFLWHVFGAVACYSMFQYVYEINLQHEPQPQTATVA
jgi:hemolysin III